MTTKKNSILIQNTKHWHEIKKNDNDIIFLPKTGRFSWVHFLNDPIFDSYLFQRFITHFMKDGKKIRIQKLFYRLFNANASEDKFQLNYFFQIIENLRPSFLLVPVRHGKNIERVPMPVSASKSYKKAMRFFVAAVKDRKFEKTLEEKIYNEFFDILFTPGFVNKYAEENFKLCVDNSHLKHYRRFGVI